MEWVKSMTGMEAKEEPVAVVMDDMPAPEAPSDFVMAQNENTDLKTVKPYKYEDISNETKSLILEQHEFHDGLVVAMQAPIVEPQGTPPPPHGPGPHKNYQATVTQKYTLSSKPQASHVQFGVQASFKPDRSDAVICNYSNAQGPSGIMARSFGPVDMIAQWVQTPYGTTALYANADYKASSSITSLNYVRGQTWSLAHMQSLWRGIAVGVKAKYTIGQSTAMSAGARWQSPRADHVWSGEAETDGSFKVGVVKRMEGQDDTTMAATYEYAPSQQGQPPQSQVWFGFGREYTAGTRLRIALNQMLQSKVVLEGMIGKGRTTFSMTYDPHQRALKHGISFEM